MLDYREMMAAFREDTAQPAPVVPARRPLWPVGVVVLAAAAAVGVVLWPAPPLAGALRSGSLTREVELEVDGTGRVDGTARALLLAWDAGTLGVEVEPDRGVQLAVETDEARVEVVGTGFVVARDPLGTRVDVRHGRVRVTCDGTFELTEGASHTCLPRSAAGRLGRVRMLQAAGAADLLPEITAALALPDATGPTAQELRSVELDVLLAQGSPDALPLAEALAAEGGPRTIELHRIAARLRLRADADCAGALPHLRALAAADALGDDAPWLATCSARGHR